MCQNKLNDLNCFKMCYCKQCFNEHCYIHFMDTSDYFFSMYFEEQNF